MVLLLALLGCTEIGLNDTSDGPTIELVTPVDGGTFDPRGTVQVCASVTYGPGLDALDAVVVSDTGEVLASEGFEACAGGDLGVAVTLSDQAQTVSMTVTDPQGRSATDSAALTPLQNGSPSCSVLVPTDGEQFQAPATTVPLTVQVGDPDDTEPDDLTIRVESTVDGLLVEEPVTAGVNASYTLDLSAATHGLLVSVADPRGATGSCQVGVAVVEGGTDAFDDDGDGYSEDDGDCDDADAAVHPGASEIPDDGVDQDCDGDDATTCFVDADQDGYGWTTTVLAPDGSCDTVDSEADDDTDCDDADAAVNPGATEIPGDGVDQDCDGADLYTCFSDGDGDGFGTSVTVVSADADCDDPGEAPVDGDCADANPDRFPGNPEVPDDGIDQDCSGDDTRSCYTDQDDDEYGVGNVVLAEGTCGALLAAVDGDCDDDDAAVNPGGTEVADDGIDQDCSGEDRITCFEDLDEDTWGSDIVTLADDGSCDTAQQESDRDGDCDDTTPSVNPDGDDSDATDGIDRDCDGVDGTDADGDGYAGGTGPDCDDSDPQINPGAGEDRNGADDDCDGMCDEGLIQPGDLIVTELMIDPESSSDNSGEWIEIHNPTAIDITLCHGWSLEDQGQDFVEVTGDPTIPAGGYLLAGKSSSPGANGDVPIDFEYGQGPLYLANDPDEIELWFDGTRIYSLDWPFGFETPGASQQLSLSAYGPHAVGDPDDWCDSEVPWTGVPSDDYGSPGADNAVCP